MTHTSPYGLPYKPWLCHWLNVNGTLSIAGGIFVAIFVAGGMKSMPVFFIGLGIISASLPAFIAAKIIELLYDIKERLPTPDKDTIK